MTDGAFLWKERIGRGAGAIAAVGYAAMALFAAGFGYWAATAPLAGAAVASGVIAAPGRNVIVQHLDGGIIKNILVREGDRVRAGQPLVVLDPIIAETQLHRLMKRTVTLTSSISRLEVERDGASELVLPGETDFDFGVDGIGKLIAEQQKEFAARLARFRSEQDILHQRVAALRQTVVGLQSQRQAIRRQIVVVEEELSRKKGLLDQGLAGRSDYTMLLRSEADLIGQAGMIEAQIASSTTQIMEAREQIARLATQRVEKAVSELTEARTSLADVEEQRKAAEAVLERTVIRAPVDGIVVSSIHNATGGVVGAGEKLMEILPTAAVPVVDARLRPQDIDAVRAGQHARLRLSALNMRKTPQVDGTVMLVSADRLMDEATREPYYSARLKIADALPEGVTAGQIQPGMPVEVFISTGERTFFDYLVRPLLDSFNRAFTEE
ncbi:hemolysin D [Paramesorhizobium deserti]|uniref:Membrane fusion protein (MFP) family protein n=2 Tax=Paramesorhizobium deserti TaxID=1494590 RepID=A0A135HTJ3_9HYPH|nr:hemolysin D [Paramesorhizobium deserti]